MAFSWDVYRDMLLRIGDVDSSLRTAYPVDTLNYYAQLLRGLVTGAFSQTRSGIVRDLTRVTEDGQKFADFIRNDARWAVTRRNLESMHVELPLSMDVVQRLMEDPSASR
jgi:hypothetical protein